MDPLHVTEFASERYFDKLRQLDENPDAANTSPADVVAASTSTSITIPSAPTFESLPLPFRPSEQRKRSVGHDLTSLRTQRRPSFGSFGSLRSRIIHKSPSLIEQQHEDILEEPISTTIRSSNLCELFLALPNELQAQIVASLPIHEILNLRLASRSFHALITLNENPIARYHVKHSLPTYTLRLYPLPQPTEITLHYVCGIWHRLHVAAKLSKMIAEQATKEIFLRNTEAQRREFEPQYNRMRQRLMPLIFTLFHFFETYRDIHVQQVATDGTTLGRWPYTLNPIECRVMDMYDDQTLLKVHQVFPLVLSSFSRRLRPPSYAGRIEKTLKGYLRDRPPDEVYATILGVGGLRQAQRFWETKGYNARRAAVDTWYSFVARDPIDPPQKSKRSLIPHLGWKKHNTTNVSAADTAVHDATSCQEWFCVKPACSAAQRQQMCGNLAPPLPSSLTAGPPMRPLSLEQLRLLVPDLQPLTNIWLRTAEALILERKIVERTQDIKRNTQVLLELIKDDGTDGIDDWIHANSLERSPTTASTAADSVSNSGAISD